MKVTRADDSKSSLYPKVIKVPFPEEKYLLLLRHLGLERTQVSTAREYRKIFVNAIFRFLKGEWSQDDLSSVAHEFWALKEEKNDELGRALYECSELIFYVRNTYTPLSPDYNGQFNPFMSTTMQYYEKHAAEIVIS